MRIWCIAGWAFLVVASAVAAGTVRINEIMYHPMSEDVREEYVELVNIGTTDVDLNGWSFSRGIRFGFSNVTLRAGSYLVVAADVSAFHQRYPDVTNVVGNWEGILSNSHDDLDLDDAAGNRVDRVPYADEGDWAERHRGLPDRNHQGVVWDADHDGKGRSLELINPLLSNDFGGNWAESAASDGSPGTINGVHAANLPPLILEVRHFPLIPRSSDRVVVTLRLLDERTTGLSVRLHWRLDATDPSPFASVVMFDDGLHEDGSPADGVFAGEIPPQANNAIVEFYVEASDAEGLSRSWPGPVRELDGAIAQVANVLFQVDDLPYVGEQPLYKLILRASDYAELYVIGHATNGEERSNAQFNATFLSLDGTGTECRYAVGVRNRGHGTRNKQPNNWRINFRSDALWRGVSALNVNGQYPHLQHVGAALSLASGLAAAQARPAQLRVNNTNLGLSSGRMFNTTYVVNEVYNSEFADHRFPSDSSGNLYRTLRDLAPSEFSWRGTNASSYTNTWFKATNVSEDDWTDLIDLARVLGTNDLYSAAAAGQVADVDQWLRYFAVMALMNNRETSPNRGYNDDYLLYAGVQDPRFQLLPYDLDTILGQGDAIGSTTDSVFGAVGQLAFQHILEEPEFRTAYFRTLRRLLATSFSPERFDVLVDQMLSEYVPASTRDSLKAWMADRRIHVRSEIPSDLPPDVTVRATLRGTPRSPTPATWARMEVGGVGVVEYRYGLDGAPLGSAQPVTTLLEFPLVSTGNHELRVIGGAGDGVWQAESDATVVRWVVAPSWPPVRLNEVLALNQEAAAHEGTFPDTIELYNEAAAAFDLTGIRLTDDSAKPDKFTFPAGASIDAGGFLRLHANNPDGTSGVHLGFALNGDGEGVYLYDRVSRGGALLDQVVFGPQLADRSIGRVQGGGEWWLVSVSPGAANTALPLAEATGVRINEWLADGRAVFTDDFVELYNTGNLPVDLGGLSLTDNVTSAVDRHVIAPLTFIGPGACLAFLADGEIAKGPRHLGFKLAPEQGEIGLFGGGGLAIDLVLYGTQQTDVSEGRQPSGENTLAKFLQPTPGALNPAVGPNVVEASTILVSLTNWWAYNATEELATTAWTEPDYDDTAWPRGQAGFWHDEDPISGPTNTPLDLGRTTYYFRTTFQYAGVPAAAALRFHALVDDGAVVYLNGTELYRLRLPTTGAIDYDSYASPMVDNAVVEGPFPVSSNPLRPGDNVIAVEVHQSGSSSADIAFALQLEAIHYATNHLVFPVVLNEVLANSRAVTNHAGRVVDYLELRNLDAAPFDASGMSLTDQPTNPRRFVLPTGTVIPSGGRWAIDCDSGLPASPTNTGFALNADGGTVQLFDSPARGGGLVDSLTYGPQAGDLSLGRVPDGHGEWTLTQPTPSAENLSVTLGHASGLRINEWLAASPDADDWFELFNTQHQPVALGGLHLSNDPGDRTRFAIAPLSFVGAGVDGRVVLVADDNASQGPAHVNFKLDADGGFVGLYDPAGGTLDSIAFGPQRDGASEGRFPDGSETRAVFTLSVSRGTANWLPLPNVVVNEVLAHTDPPWEDAVEFYNPTDSPVPIGGWYLSNSEREPRRFRLPAGTVLGARGYLVVYENQFNVPGSANAFTFNSARGDAVILSVADELGQLSGWRAFAEFGPSANGVAMGRHQTTVGTDFVALSRPTFGIDAPASVAQFRLGTGAANPAPSVGPIVITELMFCPPPLSGTNDNTVDEFVELFNSLGVSQPLFDPGAPTNVWRLAGAVDFRFPPNVTLSSGEHVLVVSFDPASEPAVLAGFRSRYGVLASTRLFGPWQGRLGNSGETVRLYQPDSPQLAPHPDAGLVPDVLRESVSYRAGYPWPGGTVATGSSLQRAVATGYGNEPLNWFAALPTAGRPSAGNPNPDGNEDGLPDLWQSQYFGTATAPEAAPGLDPDLDGSSNAEEYLAGTVPSSSSSVLRVVSVVDDNGQVQLQFETAVGRTYSLQYRETLSMPTWISVLDFGPVIVPGLISVPVDSTERGERFYRIVTPAQP